ncbi:MAG: aminotransferase class III-fold pyridoxal phosphate-dependent enzyme, partial [Proteobacteria bacterium]|nr:aminotransferase class III-fold pyridoxal phosphate-dependent enzyme [Pseudomonadota bacterium]
AAAAALVEAVAREASERALAAPDYARAIATMGRLRGRPLLLPAIASGAGRGARVRLADGTWKLDWIGGIGVYAFGHADRDLVETAAIAAASDAVFQGHLLPGPEYVRVSRALLRHAGKRLRHVWLSISGAMANENALKMLLQKRHPADRLVAFEGNFAGRTTTLAELTDKAAYREGLPLRGNVLLVPFYDASDPDPIGRSLAALDAHLHRHPGQIAAMSFELVQGEGGIRTAPREFFLALMQRCRARFEALARRCEGAVSRYEGIGAMHAFVAFDGKADVTNALVRAAWEEGLFVFTAGASPMRIRLLLPVNTTDEELEAGFAMLEKALRRVGEAREIPC